MTGGPGPDLDLQRQIARVIRSALLASGEALPPIAAPDWPRVAEVAEREGLGPLLHAALKTVDRADEPPPEVRERLQKAHVLTSTANWLAFQELGRLLERLAAENIPVVLLKGCALAGTLYGDAGLRPMHDLDLLAAPADAGRLGEVLLSLGYEATAEMTEGFGESFLQERIYVRGGARPAQVDAHWHLTSMPYYRRRIPIEWFWEHTAEQLIEGRAARVLAAEALLLHLSLHFALQHWSSRLLWSHDLALLLARHGGSLDWGEVTCAAQEFGLAKAVESSLANVRQWWGIEAPPVAMARLRAARPRPTERLLLAVMTTRRREARVISDGLSLPGLRAKLGYWLGLVFPSPAYMRRRYGIAHSALLPLYYLLRISQGTFRVARSVVSIGIGALRAVVST